MSRRYIKPYPQLKSPAFYPRQTPCTQVLQPGFLSLFHHPHLICEVVLPSKFNSNPCSSSTSTAMYVSPLGDNGTHSPTSQSISQTAERMIPLMWSHPRAARPEILHCLLSALKSQFKILHIVHQNTEMAGFGERQCGHLGMDRDGFTRGDSP